MYEIRKSKLADDEKSKFDLCVTHVVRFQEMLETLLEVLGWTILPNKSSLAKSTKRSMI